MSDSLDTLPGWLQGPLGRLLAMKPSLPHALLIVGPRGIGKAMLADRFAQSLLCEAPGGDGAACGRCDACGWYRSGNHPDFRRLSPLVDEDATPKSERSRHEIKIDQVRALADFVGIGAHRAGRKLVLIDPAEAMNMPAANALLKTLEEPSGDTVFLLVCGNAGALPATVRSRCVPFEVGTPPPDQALAWLRQHLEVSPEQAQAWLTLADGAPFRASRFAEPGIGTAHRMLLQALADIPENAVSRVAEGFASLPPAAWLPMLQAWVGDLARVCAGGPPARFVAQAKRLQNLAARTALGRVTVLGQWLDRQAPILEHPLNARLFAEDTWMRYESIFAEAP